jgi:hypothetical protein
MSRRAVGAVLAFALLLGGCSSARVGQFRRFADAGTAYADAVGVLVGEAAEVTVDADSAVLTKARTGLAPEERGQTILENNDLVRQRLDVLNDVRAHAQALRMYFVALAALADAEAPVTIASSAETAAQTIQEIGDRIGHAAFGEFPVKDFAGSASGIVVGSLQRAALERELSERAQHVERAIDLQHAALRAIAEEMKTDLATLIASREATEVVAPYASKSETLPAGWAQRRKEILTVRNLLPSVDAAAAAAQNLKLTFVALVERRVEPASFEALLRDVNEILLLIESIEGGGRPE